MNTAQLDWDDHMGHKAQVIGHDFKGRAVYAVAPTTSGPLDLLAILHAAEWMAGDRLTAKRKEWDKEVANNRIPHPLLQVKIERAEYLRDQLRAAIPAQRRLVDAATVVLAQAAMCGGRVAPQCLQDLSDAIAHAGVK